MACGTVTCRAQLADFQHLSLPAPLPVDDRLRAERAGSAICEGKNLKSSLGIRQVFRHHSWAYQSLSGNCSCCKYWSSADVCASGTTINCESRLIAGILSVLTGQIGRAWPMISTASQTRSINSPGVYVVLRGTECATVVPHNRSRPCSSMRGAVLHSPHQGASSSTSAHCDFSFLFVPRLPLDTILLSPFLRHLHPGIPLQSLHLKPLSWITSQRK